MLQTPEALSNSFIATTPDPPAAADVGPLPLPPPPPPVFAVPATQLVPVEGFDPPFPPPPGPPAPPGPDLGTGP